ncbi:MAG: NAD(P)/FAD-dependent oxidoreductase [Planctomycetia bacterium]|nr:NAD(P)/FAD-dependent oxidoreductase [Planctomycetia bacterium]
MEDSVKFLSGKSPESWDIIIIGAGPAGIFAGIASVGFSCENRKRVLILEKMSRAGRKLLISGSGRCNLTHVGPIREFFSRYGRKEQFVKPALMNFSNENLLEFLKSRGLSCFELNDGKIFPRSERARDVLETLLSACNDFHVRLDYEQEIENLSWDSTTERFLIRTVSGRKLSAQKIIIAVGGKSYPTTGSTGDGVGFARTFGHSITPLKPALTPIYVERYSFTSCAGIALPDVHLSLWRGGQKIGAHIGDVLFTHHGLSGPGILDMSRDFEAGDVLRLASVRTFSLSDCTFTLSDRGLSELLQENPQREIGNLLRSAFELPDRFVVELLASAGISERLRAWEVTKKVRKVILGLLTDFPFTIQKVGGFREAMVTAGGVNGAEVNRKTMESKLVSGLYFAGEVLDVDGDTGGFNLQFAFSSGVLAGQNARKTLRSVCDEVKKVKK